MLEKVKVEEIEISREHPHCKMSSEQRLKGGEGGSHVDIQVTAFQAERKTAAWAVQWENASFKSCRSAFALSNQTFP